jgi:hypothetical protein
MLPIEHASFLPFVRESCACIRASRYIGHRVSVDARSKAQRQLQAMVAHLRTRTSSNKVGNKSVAEGHCRGQI